MPELLKGQVKIEANASKKVIEVGEPVEINFIISGKENIDISRLQYPTIKKAKLLGSRKQNNYFYRNGESIYQKIETLVVSPEEEGRLVIPPVSVEVNGERYTSNQVIIRVNKTRKNHTINSERTVFLEVELSENSVYENEPIIATVKLYSASYDLLRNRKEVLSSGLKDFQIKKISTDTERNINQELVGDRAYVSEEVGKYQLIPQKSGNLVIPPFEVALEITDFFDTKMVSIDSEPQRIKVKPLPSGIPKNFSGVVGNFKINTYVDDKKLKANEAFQIEIELIGEGNLSSLQMPKLQLDKNLEIYEPIRRNKFQTTEKGEKGKVVSVYSIVPQYGGKYTIPAIEFTFFNPKTKKYETINSQPIDIDIEGDPMPQNINQDSISLKDSILEKLDIYQNKDEKLEDTPGVIPEIIKPVAEEINYIEKIWYLAIPTILMGLGGLFFFLFRRKKKEEKAEDIYDFRIEQKELIGFIKNKEIENSLQKSEQILTKLVDYLKEKEQDMKPEVSERYVKIKKEIQLHRYAGESLKFPLDKLAKDIDFIISKSIK